MKIYYVANARIPTEKAHGIQIAKMCEAFIEAGANLTLVVPRRATDSRSPRDYYGLRVDVPLVRLPVVDWYGRGRLGYVLSSLSFICSYLIFLARKKAAGERFLIYTVDLDTFSSSPLVFLHQPLFSEMHTAKRSGIAQRVLFKHIRGVIAINRIIVKELQQAFPHSGARYITEPNGVDLAAFPKMTKQEARTRLGLPHDISIVLYAGRFFEWKGLEILPKAAAMTPAIRWQIVGGDEVGFKELVKEPLPENFFFAGSRPYNEMPLWCAAADVLLVLGTKRDVQSYRYTSPMKLFEYLATGQPIIASGTPAIREIVSEAQVLFYEPDDAQDLARAVDY
ncbi:MAG: glycosyltransferase, partial [bacterium]|nr:glycosyltransferase [bacterium]